MRDEIIDIEREQKSMFFLLNPENTEFPFGMPLISKT